MNTPEQKFISPLGYDYTQYITSDEQEKLFHRLCIAELNSKKPLAECYRDVVEALNLDAELRGRPKRAFIQANPDLN